MLSNKKERICEFRKQRETRVLWEQQKVLSNCNIGAALKIDKFSTQPNVTVCSNRTLIAKLKCMTQNIR